MVDLAETGVGDGDAMADAGGPEALALEQGVEQNGVGTPRAVQQQRLVQLGVGGDPLGGRGRFRRGGDDLSILARRRAHAARSCAIAARAAGEPPSPPSLSRAFATSGQPTCCPPGASRWRP